MLLPRGRSGNSDDLVPSQEVRAGSRRPEDCEHLGSDTSRTPLLSSGREKRGEGGRDTQSRRGPRAPREPLRPDLGLWRGQREQTPAGPLPTPRSAGAFHRRNPTGSQGQSGPGDRTCGTQIPRDRTGQRRMGPGSAGETERGRSQLSGCADGFRSRSLSDSETSTLLSLEAPW